MPPHSHDHVRASYDAVAATYWATYAHELDAKPLDRALMRVLTDATPGDGSIADIGCGPGHVAAWLAATPRRAVGIDLSPAMVAVGAAHYPDVEFRQGDFLDLPATDGEFHAAVALYSLIHLERDEVPAAAQELYRVLTPGGLLLVAFHCGDETRHRDEWWGHRVALDFHLWTPDQMAAHLEAAGFAIDARVVRRPYPGEVETQRAYLLACRPPAE
jgi:ubiquinone/menaquinone biosynthesis C-methylase UbiE